LHSTVGLSVCLLRTVVELCTESSGLDCSLLGAIGMHYAHLRLALGLGLGLGLGLVLGLGVGLALVFSET